MDRRFYGRYHRVRLIDPHGDVSLPYVLDKGCAHAPSRLIPYGGENEGWVTLPDGVVVPALRGGVAGKRSDGQMPRPGLFDGVAYSNTQGPLALSSAFVYGVSGNAAGFRIHSLLNVAAILTDAYVYVTGYTGTAADVDDLDFEFRNVASDWRKPGSTVHASASVDPGGIVGWKRFTGMSFSALVNTPYWAVVSDLSNPNFANYASVLLQMNQFTNADTYNYLTIVQNSTTDGFATLPAAGSRAGSCVLVFDKFIMGPPYSAFGNSASNTNQKGLRLAVNKPLDVLGFGTTPNGAANMTGQRLWEGSNGPGGTGYVAASVAAIEAWAATSVPVGFRFGAIQTLQPGTSYRLVNTYSSNQFITALTIGTGADANLKAAMFGGGSWYYAEANGTTDWSNDDTARFPVVALIISDESVQVLNTPLVPPTARR